MLVDKVSGAYFRRISLFWIACITLSFGYYTLLMFWPQSIPYQSLGPLGIFSKYLMDNYYTHLYFGYWLAWGLHLAEALYSIKVCRPKRKQETTLRIQVQGWLEEAEDQLLCCLEC
ncbi:transmembrane protein 254 isoform X3 [Chiloscyllium punctatum]|uniref:transmembrane protein 254 isoform X3 n=1 Tax=Chiloscyllium punctatum TaxID=137246 RepID=UPI003B63E32C